MYNGTSSILLSRLLRQVSQTVLNYFVAFQTFAQTADSKMYRVLIKDSMSIEWVQQGEIRFHVRQRLTIGIGWAE